MSFYFCRFSFFFYHYVFPPVFKTHLKNECRIKCNGPMTVVDSISQCFNCICPLSKNRRADFIYIVWHSAGQIAQISHFSIIIFTNNLFTQLDNNFFFLLKQFTISTTLKGETAGPSRESNVRTLSYRPQFPIHYSRLQPKHRYDIQCP